MVSGTTAVVLAPVVGVLYLIIGGYVTGLADRRWGETSGLIPVLVWPVVAVIGLVVGAWEVASHRKATWF